MKGGAEAACGLREVRERQLARRVRFYGTGFTIGEQVRYAAIFVMLWIPHGLGTRKWVLAIISIRNPLY